MANEESIQKLQMNEQKRQTIAAQKQQFQSQLLEVDSALDSLKGKRDAFKIVGNIMIKTDSESLNKDLAEKKEMLEMRITALEKQEESINKEVKELQEKVMKGMEKK